MSRGFISKLHGVCRYNGRTQTDDFVCGDGQLTSLGNGNVDELTILTKGNLRYNLYSIGKAQRNKLER
jgi:hypothetical protein